MRPKDRPDEEAGAATVNSGADAEAGGLTPAELAAEVAMLGREKPPVPATAASAFEKELCYTYVPTSCCKSTYCVHALHMAAWPPLCHGMRCDVHHVRI